MVSLLVVAYRTAHPGPVPKWQHFFQHVSAGESSRGAMTECTCLWTPKDLRIYKEYQSNLTHKPMEI